LRGRFVVGFNPSDSLTPANSSSVTQVNYGAVGNTGGKNGVTLANSETPLRSHTHRILGSTKTDGAHQHVAKTYMEIEDNGSGRKILRLDHDKEQEIDDWYVNRKDGAHSHAIDFNSQTPNGTFSVSAHENRPPYYVLAFIMRVQ
jgi:microcystin-dependent protein